MRALDRSEDRRRAQDRECDAAAGPPRPMTAKDSAASPAPMRRTASAAATGIPIGSVSAGSATMPRGMT